MPSSRPKLMLFPSPAPLTEKLPQIGDVRHTIALEKFVEQYKLEFVLIDPAYLAMVGTDFGNLFLVGERLKVLSDVTAQTGCDFMLVHHARKNTGDERYALPQLEHIAWAGFQEWARQWILLNRREPYEPGTGSHKLWLAYGGSAGHSGGWGVDIDEGQFSTEHSRHWYVSLSPMAEVRSDEAAQQEVVKTERQNRRVEQDAQKIFDVLGQFPEGLTKNNLKTHCSLSTQRITPAINFALNRGWIIGAEIAAKSHNTPYPGFKRHPDLADLADDDSPLGAVGTLGIQHPDCDFE